MDNVDGDTSDGYHTFDELYEHRNWLFATLLRDNTRGSWKSKLHDDGTNFEGWFIAGLKMEAGPITYHLPMSMWDDLRGVTTRTRAPKWDGHTASDVVARLKA